MTKHELARRFARCARDLHRRGLLRRRKTWLAKRHRTAIKIALAVKANKSVTRSPK